MVPEQLCTAAALNKINKVKAQLNLDGDGDVHPFCCNFDFCNLDMCTAKRMPAGHPNCNTTIEYMTKLTAEITGSDPVPINNQEFDIISNVSNCRSVSLLIFRGLNFCTLFGREIILKSGRATALYIISGAKVEPRSRF
jgi:hypothetical protein